MKKIFALLLIVLMLVPFVASCRNGDDDDDKPGPDVDLTFDEVMAESKGETVNIMAASWGEEPGAPWSQVELCVSAYGGEANGYGKKINDAVVEREEYIKNTYDVDLNWIYCGGASMLSRLAESSNGAGDIIHVALPHVFEAQEIVVQKAIYALSDDYINYDADYYNQEASDAFTLAGNTFYVAGDISFLDEQTSYVIYYNNAVAEQFGSAFPDLYAQALNGTWTIDNLYALAEQVSENVDKKDEYTDGDKYGFGTTQLSSFYQYFGVYQIGKGTDMYNNEQFIITVENDKVETIIEKMLYCTNNEASIRTNWTGGYDAMGVAFGDDRLLFYQEVFQKVFNFDSELKVGLLPFPKLTVDQERYYVPFAQQATIACVPRATDNKDLSECMIEILSQTGAEYITPAYLNEVENNLYYEYSEKSMQVLKEQIFPNLMYDLGYMYGRFHGDGDGLITTSIQGASIDGNKNSFSTAIGSTAMREAEDFIINWSEAYNAYTE